VNQEFIHPAHQKSITTSSFEVLRVNSTLTRSKERVLLCPALSGRKGPFHHSGKTTLSLHIPN
jgi:hypothetical protein